MPIKNVTFKGVSRIPADSVSDEGGLCLALNVAKDNEIDCELIERPVKKFAKTEYEPRYIHINNGYKHYILYFEQNLYWVDSEHPETISQAFAGVNDELYAIETIGNTIVFTDYDGMHYVLWDEQTQNYVYLGQKPPVPDIRFSLDTKMQCYPDSDDPAKFKIKKYATSVDLPFILTKGMGYDIEEYAWATPSDQPQPFTDEEATPKIEWTDFDITKGYLAEDEDAETVRDDVVNEWTERTMSYINKFIADYATNKNKFCFPFFVRYAVELYDGTTVMHSYPTLMVPGKGVFFGINGQKGLYLWRDSKGESYEHRNIEIRGRAYGAVGELKMETELASLHASLAKWKDIIRGVGIYITPPIYTHRQNGKVTGWMNMDNVGIPGTGWGQWYGEGKFSKINLTNYAINKMDRATGMFATSTGSDIKFTKYNGTSVVGFDYNTPSYIMRLDYLNDTEIFKEITQASTFYRVAFIDYDTLMSEDNIGTFASPEAVIDANDKTALMTLTSSIKMVDDFHSRDNIGGNVLNVYNRRLNLADTVRQLHNPLSPTIQWPRISTSTATTGYAWEVAIYLKSLGVDRIVTSPIGYFNTMPRYLFYPDSSAYKAVLRRREGIAGSYTYTHYEVKLKKHTGLEGAYWYDNDELPHPAQISTSYPTSKNTQINEGGMLMTSEAENPFFFPASGYNVVGDGKILAMAQAVQALSQGQFGIHPMYCFTSLGVWALSVAQSGGWTSIQPVTRDVICDNTKPLSIDTSVIFIAPRGVLMLAGAKSKQIDTLIQGEWKDAYSHLSPLVNEWSDESDELPNRITSIQQSKRIAEGTKMLYDYKHQRIYFGMDNFSWVYNLKCDQWTQSQTVIENTLNSYPYCEFTTSHKEETESGEIVTVHGIYSLDGDAKYNTAIILTRPIKSGGEAFARVLDCAARGTVPLYVNNLVAVALYGCRDWINHLLIGSSTRPRLTRIGGTPFKTHSLLVMMRKFGTSSYNDKLKIQRAVLDIQPDHTDKVR